MSKLLKTTFLIHAVVSVVSGLLLLVMPGRILLSLGWAPIDPILSRLLGAALLALAWSSFRGWQAHAGQRAQVQIVLELEAAFSTLACVGLLRHLLFARWPLMVWLLFGVLLIFAACWIVFLMRRE